MDTGNTSTLEITSDLDLRIHTVAQGETNEAYENNGFVAVVKEGVAGVARFGHCSCYGTYTAIRGGSYATDGGPMAVWDWTGTPDEMVRIARESTCIIIDGRPIDPTDYDYHQLVELYGIIIAWDEAGRPEHNHNPPQSSATGGR